jgi:hypothetical protein
MLLAIKHNDRTEPRLNCLGSVIDATWSPTYPIETIECPYVRRYITHYNALRSDCLSLALVAERSWS